MKLSQETLEVGTVGEVVTAEATICVTPESFRILSSDLYKDPIAAVMREIACNAQDANAGKPISIHLPNRFEPTFEVHDEGSGIPPERMAEVYLSYFGSTKRDDVISTGYFGLGSKSPLAYGTKNFTVVSYYAGVATTYAIYLNTEGIPTIGKLGEASTNKTGLSVSIPVRAEDIQTFCAKASEVYKFFDPKPSFNTQVEFKEEARWLDAPSYYITPGGASSYITTRSLYAIMGPVCYHIENDEFTERLDRLPLKACRLYLKPPMGALRPTPSREAISLDDASKVYLHDAFNIVETDLKRIIQKAVDECKTVQDLIKVPQWLKKEALPLKFGDVDFQLGYQAGEVDILNFGAVLHKNIRGYWHNDRRKGIIAYNPKQEVWFNDTKRPPTPNTFDLSPQGHYLIFLENEEFAKKVAAAVGVPLKYLSTIKKPSAKRDVRTFTVRSYYPKDSYRLDITRKDLETPFYYVKNKYSWILQSANLCVESGFLKALPMYGLTNKDLYESKNAKKYGIELSTPKLEELAADFITSLKVEELVECDIDIEYLQQIVKHLKGQGTEFERLVAQVQKTNKKILMYEKLSALTAGKQKLTISMLENKYSLLTRETASRYSKELALYILKKEGK